ncbi:glycosyltransferase involved in cell wall biosynthesis [Dysgonomonas sp. PH5-45]|uniref:glycosyltransferase family 2 protein n=1 Tax=unclassified Dysgonomonas TaxID=2630389 RepID=UPI002476CA73|nr:MULTISPECIES: glycosyltransferase family 2 protein [unclassified Dysgonomonas]MDH6355296.1 glycosyltransferase involved in cell wall biosynthesis [Dysgonomonas sp. PH5-45]MDH6388178.1 glycosyltransferase involved in cell wall biosynthesis [Dysgonomonas sp. PH5-37]
MNDTHQAQPLVTVVMPFFNEERFIAAAIDSIIEQTYKNWELLIVDDGSTDGSAAIVDSYIGTDPRLRLYKRQSKQRGASVCRNIGLREAKGDYIIFFDSDDLLFPQCLENRVNKMLEYSDADFIVFQMCAFFKDGYDYTNLLSKEKDNYLYAFLSHNIAWGTTCAMLKPKFIREKLNGGFNERYPRLQDAEFYTRALLVDNVNYEMFISPEYIDCAYRMEQGKSLNIEIALTGFSYYIEDFYELVKNRPDSKECIFRLSQLYTKCFSYLTMFTDKQTIKPHIEAAYGIIRKARKRKIIPLLKGLQNRIMLFCLKNNLYDNRLLRRLLSMVGIKAFYKFD